MTMDQECDMFQKIRLNMVDLKNDIDLSSGLYDHLYQASIIEQENKEEFKEGGAGSVKQVGRLLEFMLKRPVEGLHGFCEALVKSNQKHIVTQYINPQFDKQYTGKNMLKRKAPGKDTIKSNRNGVKVKKEQPVTLKQKIKSSKGKVMSDDHKKRLTKDTKKVVNGIQEESLLSLVNSLLSARVVDEHKKGDILSKQKNPVEQKSCLLDAVKSSNERGFYKFVQSLVDEEYIDLARSLVKREDIHLTDDESSSSETESSEEDNNKDESGDVNDVAIPNIEITNYGIQDKVASCSEVQSKWEILGKKLLGTKNSTMVNIKSQRQYENHYLAVTDILSAWEEQRPNAAKLPKLVECLNEMQLNKFSASLVMQVKREMK